MAMIAPDKFRQRALRAYEWGRLRHAAVKAWPALLLTAVSWWLCHEQGLSFAIGGSLFALATGLFWYGRVAALAASAGIKAGMVAFAVPVLAFHFFAPQGCSLTTMLLINGGCGLGVGVLLSIESAPLQIQRNVFLLFASVVASISGMLGCILFGPMGLAGMAAGVLLATAPVAIYRHANA
jgi:hypothetical protein